MNADENIWKTYTRIRTKKEQILLLQQESCEMSVKKYI